jgi:hypothetical protein
MRSEILSEGKIDGYINSYKFCHVVKGILRNREILDQYSIATDKIYLKPLINLEYPKLKPLKKEQGHIPSNGHETFKKN